MRLSLVLLLCASCTPAASAVSARAASPRQPEPPPAPAAAPVGTPLAAGTVSLTLEGLTTGDARPTNSLIGEAVEGPETPTDHVWVRDTAEGRYELHVVAWETFEPVREGRLEALATARDAVAVATDDPGLVMVAQRRAGAARPRLLGLRVSGAPTLSRPMVQRAAITVGPRGGTFTAIALACDDGDACRADDIGARIEELGHAIVAGTPLGGGEWTVALPDGPDHDRHLTFDLPAQLLGLPWRASGPREWQAPVVALDADGTRIAFRLTMGTRPTGGRSALPCAPFQCVLRADDAHAEVADALLARARQERVPARPVEVPLAAGRLIAHTAGPFVDDDGRLPPSVWPTTHLRLAVGERVHVLSVRSHDTLHPVTWSATDFAELYRSEGDFVVLEATDSTLQIHGRVESEGRRELLVFERDSTAIELSVQVLGEANDQEVELAVRELARRLEHGRPPTTQRRWVFGIGDWAIELDLPEGYAVRSDAVLDEGVAWDEAVHVHRPVASLRFEAGPDAPALRSRDRRAASLGSVPLEMRRVRSLPRPTWSAALDCPCRGSCTIELEVDDDSERERLLEALAGATTSRRLGPSEDVEVRERPGHDAPSVGRIEAEDDAWTLETRDGWTRVRGRDAVSDEPIEGWVRATRLGPVCD